MNYSRYSENPPSIIYLWCLDLQQLVKLMFFNGSFLSWHVMWIYAFNASITWVSPVIRPIPSLRPPCNLAQQLSSQLVPTVSCLDDHFPDLKLRANEKLWGLSTGPSSLSLFFWLDDFCAWSLHVTAKHIVVVWFFFCWLLQLVGPKICGWILFSS